MTLSLPLSSTDSSTTVPSKLEKNKRDSTINDFWKQKYEKEAGKSWNIFYKRNERRFFKDRHWIRREIPELFDNENCKRVLEVGCGVGNFAFPYLEERGEDNLDMLFVCDFSAKAIELVKTDERFSVNGKMNAFCADLTKDDLSSFITPSSLDVVTCIFVFSAIPPSKFKITIDNIAKVLKKGGILVFRDYCDQDAAQARFKSDRMIDEHYFVRQDGTLAYYFGENQVRELFVGSGQFELLQSSNIKSTTKNMKMNLELNRSFIQAKFTKK